MEPLPLRALVDNLLSAMAVPSREVGYTCTDEERVLLETLAEHNVAESVQRDGRQQWFLTRKGVDSLSYESGLAPGQPTLALRADVPLSDRTCWECVTELMDAGWSWNRLPSKTKDQLTLPWFDTVKKASTASRVVA